MLGYTHTAINALKAWVENAGLALGEANTEAILITKRHMRNYDWIQIGRYLIISKLNIKYLGMILDARLNFKDYIQYTCKKAMKDIVSTYASLNWATHLTVRAAMESLWTQTMYSSNTRCSWKKRGT